MEISENKQINTSMKIIHLKQSTKLTEALNKATSKEQLSKNKQQEIDIQNKNYTLLKGNKLKQFLRFF